VVFGLRRSETVQSFRSGWARFAGQIVGWAAAYALVLNVILAGVLGAQLGAHESDSAAGFELCLTGAARSTDPAAPAPAGHVAGILHCLLCTSGGHELALPAQFKVGMPIRVAASAAIGVVSSHIALSSVSYLSQPPRGPPLAA
jgi:hypothetical protein